MSNLKERKLPFECQGDSPHPPAFVISTPPPEALFAPIDFPAIFPPRLQISSQSDAAGHCVLRNCLPMPINSLSRRQTLRLLAVAAVSSSLTGCGTILYPERRGQPHGRLDWGVVALDGIGLLLFFIPGVIAFAVDFATGAIYLPPEPCQPVGSMTIEEIDTEKFTIVHTKPSRENIEKAVEEKTGTKISLVDNRLTTKPMNKLRDFWSTLKSLS